MAIVNIVKNFLYFQLPTELQAKVRSYVASKQRKYVDGNGNTQKPDVKTIKVPIPTFPPTAMVYSLDTGIGKFSATKPN